MKFRIVVEQGKHNVFTFYFNVEIGNDLLSMRLIGNAGYGISQIVSAVFFLAVVFITGINYRTKLLAR